MRFLLAAAAAFQVVVLPAAAADYLWRSATTGVIAQPAATSTSNPTLPADSVSLKISMIGARSVIVGSSLDLRPVVVGAVGKVTFRYSGGLPPGAAFWATTGRITGRALLAGSYTVTVIVTDSTATSVTLTLLLTVK